MKSKCNVYSVMLEGIEASLGYFINFEVAARDPIQAEELARERAQELALKVVGVEEIAKTTKLFSSDPQVLSTSGKSYFPTGH
jgi:predicted nucleic acid-binding protein